MKRVLSAVLIDDAIVTARRRAAIAWALRAARLYGGRAHVLQRDRNPPPGGRLAASGTIQRRRVGGVPGTGRGDAMRFLRKRRDEGRQADASIDAGPAVCEHVTLIPKWDSAEDMGRADAVSMYRCDVCGAEFTPDEAARLRETERARIQRRLAG
jgi:hypothetical protein